MRTNRNIIEMNGVTKDFGQGNAKICALRGVDLTISQDDYTAIMGPSGSGKSTLLYMMGLLHLPTSGTFKLWGHHYFELDRLETARLRNQKIGFVFQDSLLLPKLPVLENIELPLYYAEVPRPERQRRAMALLEELGMARLHNQLASSISGGEKQRVAIARALINNPSLVIADEPTGSLDRQNSDNIMGMFDLLHAKGIAVVIVTHDPEVAQNCQRRIYIEDGRITSQT